MVGFGFDADDCSMDVLELLGECQLNQEGAVMPEGLAESTVQPSTLETKDDRSATTLSGLKAGAEIPGASW